VRETGAIGRSVDCSGDHEEAVAQSGAVSRPDPRAEFAPSRMLVRPRAGGAESTWIAAGWTRGAESPLAGRGKDGGGLGYCVTLRYANGL
jgi:hypothetical protein